MTARLVAPQLSRRGVLRWGVAGVAAPVGLATLGGCFGGSGGRPDPLIALAKAARDDGALIDATARRFPEYAVQLTPAAAARRAHAAALANEVRRLDPNAALPSEPTAPPSVSQLTAPPSGAAEPTAPPGGRRSGAPAPSSAASSAPQGATAATMPAVLAALEASAGTATDALAELPGYRAALVGSVAACCTAYRTVLG